MFETLTARLETVFGRLRGRGKLRPADVDEALDDIRTALLEADVEVGVLERLMERIRERASGAEVLKSLTPGQQVVKLVHETMVDTLGAEAAPLEYAPEGVTVMLVVGLQGSGKTTSAAKLARFMHNEGRRPLLAAADLQRPAAVEQLRQLGGQIGIPVFSEPSSNPVRLAKDALAHARREGLDTLIVDTAGRLSVDNELMKELDRLTRAVQPHETLLVLDAMTGQAAVPVAAEFLRHASFTGVLLSKLDGDARGGAAISVREATGRPVKLAGVGERPDDLEVFHPERMATRILGMGDVLTIIEKAERTMEEEQAAEMAGRIMRAEFTLDDFLAQFRSLRQMGSLGDLFGMLPGAYSASVDVEAADREMRRAEAMIRSMTPSERNDPRVIDGSRRRRIAAGSGTSVPQVSGMLRQFDSMRRMLQSAAQGRGPGLGLPGLSGVPVGRGSPWPAGGNRLGARPAARPSGRPRTPKKQQKKKKR